MTESVVTATEIAAHLRCPRQYEFEHERPLSPPRTSRDRVAERRRTVLRESILAGLRLDTESPDERVAAAFERFDSLWHSPRASYLADEQARYDEDAIKAAIETYLSGPGHEHGEQLLDADATLGYELDGVRYEAAVDAVIERDGRYLAVRYVADTSGILNVSWYDDNVQRFNDGRGFYPRQLGSFVRAAIALRGLMSRYGLSPTYDFAYVSLLENSRPAYADGDEIHVEIEQRRFQSAYSTEEADVNALIADRAEALLEGETDPKEWRFGEITDRSCEYCAYRDACPDYIESEMSFTDRRRADADGPPGRRPAGEFETEANR